MPFPRAKVLAVQIFGFLVTLFHRCRGTSPTMPRVEPCYAQHYRYMYMDAKRQRYLESFARMLTSFLIYVKNFSPILSQVQLRRMAATFLILRIWCSSVGRELLSTKACLYTCTSVKEVTEICSTRTKQSILSDPPVTAEA